ncbi:unnamed protein product [Cylindrotheca closterium]|uniref:Uncharacterized protein n=1 Tax=Cylindrotheca closterium TaxID=2856 RepID=A0AAD2PUQ7_9STRA|nr:unnamed protein product [Cylindrotheca closterium]
MFSWCNSANGLEHQPRSSSSTTKNNHHPMLTLENNNHLPRRRPFSGGTTRLTSILPTEGEGIVLSEQVNHFRQQPAYRMLSAVVGLSCVNIVYSMLRPDPDIGLMMRMPRIFWEICISCTAAISVGGGEGSIFRLLLAMMLGPTALIDIFFWGPILGATTTFQTCTGGYLRGPRFCRLDMGKGIGRIVGMVQSVFGGAFYMLAAAVCWSEYWQAQRMREEEARMRARIVDYSYEH